MNGEERRNKSERRQNKAGEKAMGAIVDKRNGGRRQNVASSQLTLGYALLTCKEKGFVNTVDLNSFFELAPGLINHASRIILLVSVSDMPWNEFISFLEIKP